MAFIVCELCKKKQATVHLTDIHQGEKRELHICQECAEEKGYTLQQTISLPDLLSGLSKKLQNPPAEDPVCEACGLRYSEFQSRGRLGCANDYQAFRGELTQMLDRIHGRTQHLGKRASGAADSEERRNIAQLQRRMREAVDREEYEEAAQLRDEIHQLQAGAARREDEEA